MAECGQGFGGNRPGKRARLIGKSAKVINQTVFFIGRRLIDKCQGWENRRKTKWEDNENGVYKYQEENAEVLSRNEWWGRVGWVFQLNSFRKDRLLKKKKKKWHTLNFWTNRSNPRFVELLSRAKIKLNESILKFIDFKIDEDFSEFLLFIQIPQFSF